VSDYPKVAEALARGADPKLLCETCPWDRFCITPPQITKSDIGEASRQLQEEAGPDPMSQVMSTILVGAVFGGRDTMSDTCPVFSLRLRSSEGRVLVDSIRSQMRSWDDSEVVA
jgi:hypothetical protein